MLLGYLSFALIFVMPPNYANEYIYAHTQYGDILGYQTEFAQVFYGIPFAQPPIDSLRWQPPLPIPRWAPEIINGTQPPNACPQTSSTLSSTNTPDRMSEDCLYVNIFTPIPSDTLSARSLPVMIFIHGGGFQFGYASDPSNEPEHLVNTSNVIVAFIQYRLGVLGFLATGQGAHDLHGNYGILDQRLAIAWIKANIEAFGGDSNEITLFGQSAGAQSTALHYLTGEMQSFFQRAIIQSAPMTVPFRTYSEYITSSVLLAEQLSCATNDVVCLRNRSMNEIIVAQNTVNSMLTSLNALFFFEPWLPVIDHILVPGSLLEIVHNNSFSLKPLMIGTVTDECFDFIYGSTWGKPISTSEYIALVLLLFQENGFKVIEQYPPDSSGDQRPLVARACTQWVFACSTRLFARKAASYAYVFSYPYDRESSKYSIRCRNHACHADELPYVFEAYWSNFTEAGRRVSQSMAAYWTNFATNQDPNKPAAVSLVWPRTTTTNETYMNIQDPLSIGEDYLKSDCDFWDHVGYKDQLSH